jgi:GR25 family glycosyltransferase involved in LPS biosynthesis
MTNFLLALFSLYFSLITFVASSATSSPTKPKYVRPLISYSPKKMREPAWFKKSVLGRNEETWNIFGQWFNQFKSRPFGDLVHLKSISSIDEFWSFVSTTQLGLVDRIDISIFRPGFEPDYEKFTSSTNGFILSYNVNNRIIKRPSPSNSPSKNDRNEASKDKSIEAASPFDCRFPYFRVFDPLIKAAMECENPTDLTTKIIGFVFKRQYEHTFIQIFVDGPDLKPIDMEVYVSYIYNFIYEHFPAVSLKSPLKLRLSSVSAKIVGPVTSPGNLKPSSSPLKVEEEVEEREDNLENRSEIFESENLSLISQTVESDLQNHEIDSSLDEFDNNSVLKSPLFEIKEEIENSTVTIIDQLFDIIFNEDFSIFLKDQNKLMEHFVKHLVKLVLEQKVLESQD